MFLVRYGKRDLRQLLSVRQDLGIRAHKGRRCYSDPAKKPKVISSSDKKEIGENFPSVGFAMKQLYSERSLAISKSLLKATDLDEAVKMCYPTSTASLDILQSVCKTLLFSESKDYDSENNNPLRHIVVMSSSSAQSSKFPLYENGFASTAAVIAKKNNANLVVLDWTYFLEPVSAGKLRDVDPSWRNISFFGNPFHKSISSRTPEGLPGVSMVGVHGEMAGNVSSVFTHSHLANDRESSNDNDSRPFPFANLRRKNSALGEEGGPEFAALTVSREGKNVILNLLRESTKDNTPTVVYIKDLLELLQIQDFGRVMKHTLNQIVNKNLPVVILTGESNLPQWLNIPHSAFSSSSKLIERKLLSLKLLYDDGKGKGPVKLWDTCTTVFLNQIGENENEITITQRTADHSEMIHNHNHRLFSYLFRANGWKYVMDESEGSGLLSDAPLSINDAISVIQLCKSLENKKANRGEEYEVTTSELRQCYNVMQAYRSELFDKNARFTHAQQFEDLDEYDEDDDGDDDDDGIIYRPRGPIDLSDMFGARDREPGSPHRHKSFKAMKDKLIAPGKVGVQFSDIGSLEKTKKCLHDIITLPLVRADLFKEGILKGFCSGVLLFGPPGTGKTMLAKAICNSSGANFLPVSQADLLQMYVGESEKVVRSIFEVARESAPCVIFLDEADAFMGIRSASHVSEVRSNVLSEFIAEWDGLESMKNNGILVVGATNRPFDLDSAVVRRFSRRFFVDMPSKNDRESILKLLLKDNVLCDDVNIKEIAKKTPSFSGSDLKNLCATAALLCARELFEKEDFSDTLVITKQHFDVALKEVGSSVCENISSMEQLKKWNNKFGDGGDKSLVTKMGFANASG
eukprot:Nk52_evm47s215 gene=Nk52_evmTU47s215